MEHTTEENATSPTKIVTWRSLLGLECTLVQALRLCTSHTAHRGSRGIALPFLDHGTRRGWGVSFTPRPLFTPGKDPVPIVQEAGWAPGPVWTGAENLAPTGIRSPDRPAHSQSLYRLSYSAHCNKTGGTIKGDKKKYYPSFGLPNWRLAKGCFSPLSHTSVHAQLCSSLPLPHMRSCCFRK